MGEIDQWVEIAKQCKYLPENDLKVRLKEVLRHFQEFSNIRRTLFTIEQINLGF